MTPLPSYQYDSFGNLAASTGSISNPFLYTGREFDAETGPYFYRARYYDPSIGRFISEDPIRFRGGINFYDYVKNNPVNSVDPSGQLGIFATIATGAAILTTTDFVVTTYHDYQLFKMLEEQKEFLEKQMEGTDPCSEQYRLLEEAHERAVLQQGTIAEKAGMNLIINTIGYLKPTPHLICR